MFHLDYNRVIYDQKIVLITHTDRNKHIRKQMDLNITNWKLVNQLRGKMCISKINLMKRSFALISSYINATRKDTPEKEVFNGMKGRKEFVTSTNTMISLLFATITN